jgi:DNA-binding XRE family transcriptional regulator
LSSLSAWRWDLQVWLGKMRHGRNHFTISTVLHCRASRDSRVVRTKEVAVGTANPLRALRCAIDLADALHFLRPAQGKAMTERGSMSTIELSTNHVAERLIQNVRIFLEVQQAYTECAPPIQEVVNDMKAIYDSPESTEDEKDRAITTIVEALFPAMAADFMGVCDAARKNPSSVARAKEMAAEENAFAEKVEARMAELGLTQEELAQRVGVGQSAISNMLNRQCRPQMRTIKKISQALGLAPADLWPGCDAKESHS